MLKINKVNFFGRPVRNFEDYTINEYMKNN